MVLSKEEYTEQIARLKHKKDVLLPERIEALGQKIQDMKKRLQADWGDEALAEAESTLDNLK